MLAVTINVSFTNRSEAVVKTTHIFTSKSVAVVLSYIYSKYNTLSE